MTDIIERLNDAMFDIKDKTRISPDLWNPLGLAICDATDEIKRLRAALKLMIPHVEHMVIEAEEAAKVDMKFIRNRLKEARAALVEKE